MYCHQQRLVEWLAVLFTINASSPSMLIFEVVSLYAASNYIHNLFGLVYDKKYIFHTNLSL